MSTTLTNGLKLPDKGSVDWYADMQNNYTILDGAVGTVAEHTTQIAGKASSTHTHGNVTNDGKVGTTANKPLITGTGGVVQAGSFGTSANTFCEGNDSRLSDARTPVAHTHGKADVTDLLNSNFIPSANNSYNLGSSSYQWSDVYAKRYFYNGTQWGLNVENNWIHYNRFNAYRLQIKNSSQQIGVIPTSSQWNGIQFVDKNNNTTVSIEHGFLPTETRLHFKIIDNLESSSTGSTVNVEMMRLATYTGGRAVAMGADTKPLSDNTYNLGASDRRWKTLNGINPGALSLPDFSAEFDVSGQIVPPTGESQISINWGKNTFTPSVNGWLSIRIHKATFIKIYRESRASYCFSTSMDSAADICVCSPVIAGVEYTIKIEATQFSSGYDHFRLAPCQGNV